MQIIGSVEEIVFRNNENGYTIAKLITEDGEITATGKFPIIGSGEELSLEGEMIVHPKYGVQFKAEYIKVYDYPLADLHNKYFLNYRYHHN